MYTISIHSPIHCRNPAKCRRGISSSANKKSQKLLCRA